MRIEDSRKATKTAYIEHLRAGDVGEDRHGNLVMRLWGALSIAEEPHLVPVVRITDGQTFGFQQQTEVTVVDARLLIGG